MSEDFIARRVAVQDGLFLTVRDYAPVEPDTGLPVICLHGLTRNERDFETLAPRIAALGRRVLVMTMRGRGLSDPDPDPARYNVAAYAGDVAVAMDALDAPSAVFVGTSMGGLITMVLAASQPARVAAAVLNDIGPYLDPQGLARIGGYVGKGGPVASWQEAAAAAKALNGAAFPRRADDDAFWMRFARRAFRETADGRVAPDYDPMIALAFGEQPTPAPDLGPVFQAAFSARPTLVVRGAISDLLSEDGLMRMRDLKPDLAIARVPDVGHAPTLEEPEAWDAILDFLARTP